jgi:putative secretion ATPase (PEP-CTERM system associated)
MYQDYFGLSAKPFQLNPDPDFFFGSRGHKRALAYLEYGLHQGEGFIVITGEVGAGKTTLVRGLLRQIKNDAIVPVQIVSTQVDSDDLLRLVAAAFGLESAGIDKSTLLTRLQQHFEGLNAEGRRALLIVDEAQNLTQSAVEELRMLSNFQIGTRSLVQSFLVGQPEFRCIMQRPEMQQLKQRVIASYHLGPLDAEETRSYIEHRLHHVGWQADPRFDDGAFERIHIESGGVPRRINTLCDRLLLAAYLGERHEISVEDVGTVASEMDEELGGVALGSMPLAPVYPLPVGGNAPGGQPANAAGGAQIARISSITERSQQEQIVRLEERVAMLEASSGMMFNLIKKVLRILRGTSNNESTGS